MFSIKKLKKFNFATLILVLYLIGIATASPQAMAAKSPIIKVREFKFYREINFDGRTIFLDKKSLDVLLIKDKKSIKILHGKNSKTFTFSSSDNKSSHYLIGNFSSNRRPQIGYYVTNHVTQYQEQICIDEHAYNENLKKILDPTLIKKIQSMEVSRLFDKESCGQVSQEAQDEFKDALVESMSAKTSDLKNCSQSLEAQNLFQKDMALKQNAFEVFGKYFSLIEGLQSSGIKFKCGLKSGEANKVASFSQNPLEIALNFIDKKFNLNIDNVSSTINHELIHYGMSQYKDKPNSSCIDEGFVQLFEAVCKYTPNKCTKLPPQSSKIVDQCIAKGKLEFKLNSSTCTEFIFDGVPPLTAGTIAAAVLDDKTQIKGATQTITAAVSSGTPAFEAVPNSTIQLAATAPVITVNGSSISSHEGDGEFYQVPDGSNFSASVQQLGQSLSRSMDNADHLITSALGNAGLVAAATAVGTRAIASTNSQEFKGSYAPLTATEAFAKRYYPDSEEVQAAMSNPKLDAMTYDQKENYYRSLDNGKTSAGTTVQFASDAGSAVKPTEPKSTDGTTRNLRVEKISVNGQQASAMVPNSRTVASLFSQTEDSPTASAEREEPTRKTQTEDSVTAAQSIPTVNSNIKLDNAILQRLTAFSKVNEPAYTRVTERFNDQTFRQQLDARKIRIVGENNKPLWVSSVQPQRCFRDNKTTKVLEVVACK